eukprot:693826-Rhodomonas_salina.1
MRSHQEAAFSQKETRTRRSGALWSRIGSFCTCGQTPASAVNGQTPSSAVNGQMPGLRGQWSNRCLLLRVCRHTHTYTHT